MRLLVLKKEKGEKKRMVAQILDSSSKICVLDDQCDDNNDQDDGDGEDVGVSSQDGPPGADVGDSCCDRPPSSQHTQRHRKQGCSTRRPWTEAEQWIVLTNMKKNIVLQKLPGKLQCEELIHSHKELGHTSWTMIKHFVRNEVTAAKRHRKADKA